MFSNLFKTHALRGQEPAYWLDYEAHFKKSWPRDSPLEAVRFVVLDTETTGFDRKGDHMLSIGAVSLVGWKMDLQDSFDYLIHQHFKPNGETIAVHGITPGQVAYSRDELEVVTMLLAYLRDAIIVGHHIKFDIGMLNEALHRQGLPALKNKTIDTISLSNRVSPSAYFVDPQLSSLDALCKRYKIPAHDRHTAAGDAYITAILFMKLAARLRTRGVKTLGDLLR